MNLNYLKEFVVLASHNKLTSAARALYISPSALSQHVAALEKELGCELFSRSNGFVLTKKGERALDHAQNILFSYESLLRDCSIDDKTVVRISTPNYYFGTEPISVARTVFCKAHPNTKLVITSNEHQGDDSFGILTENLSEASALYIVRGSSQNIEAMVPEGFSWIRIGAYRFVFTANEKIEGKDNAILTSDELDKALVFMKLCPVTSVIKEGIDEVLAHYGISARIMFRQITRNADTFLSDMEKGSFMLWFEAIEGSLGGSMLDKPAYRFEHDLIADAYILYYPELLDNLQLEYFDTLKRIYSERQADQN